MNNAITTRRSAARPGRIEVRGGNRRYHVQWYAELSPERNHSDAALQLASILGWFGEVVSGKADDGSWCHVVKRLPGQPG